MKILTKITHYNYVMLEARKKRGITQEQLASYMGVHPSVISKIELLKDISVGVYNIKSVLEQIADFLEIPFDEIFPPDYIKALFARQLQHPRSKYLVAWDTKVLLNSGAIKELTDGDVIDVVAKDILCDEIKEILDKLPPLERKVIELRYGMTDRGPMTLEETAKALGVSSRERVRQIEYLAMCRLRNRRVTEVLEDYRE